MYHQSYLDSLDPQSYEAFLFWSGQIPRKPLDNPPKVGYNTRMNDEDGYEYNEGSDCDNWEDEEVFQDQVQEDRADEYEEYEPDEDFGHFGEGGLWD